MAWVWTMACSDLLAHDSFSFLFSSWLTGDIMLLILMGRSRLCAHSFTTLDFYTNDFFPSPLATVLLEHTIVQLFIYLVMTV